MNDTRHAHIYEVISCSRVGCSPCRYQSTLCRRNMFRGKSLPLILTVPAYTICVDANNMAERSWLGAAPAAIAPRISVGPTGARSHATGSLLACSGQGFHGSREATVPSTPVMPKLSAQMTSGGPRCHRARENDEKLARSRRTETHLVLVCAAFQRHRSSPGRGRRHTPHALETPALGRFAIRPERPGRRRTRLRPTTADIQQRGGVAGVDASPGSQRPA